MTTIAKRPIPPTGILQEWVARLGLRHQGVLVSSIRGCDTAPKNDPSKRLTRVLRGLILNTHCENPHDARSFIEPMAADEAVTQVPLVIAAFCDVVDQCPHHFVMHAVHAIEVIAYKHPSPVIRDIWTWAYFDLAHRLHLSPETEEQLDCRLNADESEFAEAQGGIG